MFFSSRHAKTPLYEMAGVILGLMNGDEFTFLPCMTGQIPSKTLVLWLQTRAHEANFHTWRPTLTPLNMTSRSDVWKSFHVYWQEVPAQHSAWISLRCYPTGRNNSVALCLSALRLFFGFLLVTGPHSRLSHSFYIRNRAAWSQRDAAAIQRKNVRMSVSKLQQLYDVTRLGLSRRALGHIHRESRHYTLGP